MGAAAAGAADAPGEIGNDKIRKGVQQDPIGGYGGYFNDAIGRLGLGGGAPLDGGVPINANDHGALAMEAAAYRASADASTDKIRLPTFPLPSQHQPTQPASLSQVLYLSASHEDWPRGTNVPMLAPDLPPVASTALPRLDPFYNWRTDRWTPEAIVRQGYDPDDPFAEWRPQQWKQQLMWRQQLQVALEEQHAKQQQQEFLQQQQTGEWAQISEFGVTEAPAAIDQQVAAAAQAQTGRLGGKPIAGLPPPPAPVLVGGGYPGHGPAAHPIGDGYGGRPPVLPEAEVLMPGPPLRPDDRRRPIRAPSATAAFQGGTDGLAAAGPTARPRPRLSRPSSGGSAAEAVLAAGPGVSPPGASSTAEVGPSARPPNAGGLAAEAGLGTRPLNADFPAEAGGAAALQMKDACQVPGRVENPGKDGCQVPFTGDWLAAFFGNGGAAASDIVNAEKKEKKEKKERKEKKEKKQRAST